MKLTSNSTIDSVAGTWRLGAQVVQASKQRKDVAQFRGASFGKIWTSVGSEHLIHKVLVNWGFTYQTVLLYMNI